MTVGSSSKKIAGSTQGGCLLEYSGRVFSRHRESGQLAPVFGLHLPVELAKRVELESGSARAGWPLDPRLCHS